MGWRGGDAGARDSGVGTLRALMLLIGTVLLVAGVVVVATNYSDDYSCYTDLECYGDRTEPTVVDRTVTAFGFGEERSSDSDLPGPEGTLMVALGAAVLLLLLLLRPGAPDDDPIADAPAVTPAPVPRGDAVENPGPRRRVFIER
jgi:hypothetical protein